MNILLVEDYEDTRKLVETVLKLKGHKVDSHVTAESALEAFKRHPFEVAIVDLMLPKMSGVELCTQIRNTLNGKYTYILICTSRTERSALKECLKAGANDYIAKPLDLEFLEVRLSIAESHLQGMHERRLIEESLAQLHTNILLSNDSIISCQTNGKIITWNPSATKLFGYTAEEAIDQSLNILSDDDIIGKLNLCLKDGLREPFEMACRSKAGSKIMVSFSISPINEQDDKSIGAVIVARDNTTQFKVREELRISETKLQRLFESDLIGVFYWKLDGTISQANNFFLELIQYTKDDVRAGVLKWNTITPPEHEEADNEAIRQLKERGECDPFEKEYIRKDGTKIPILLGAAFFASSVDTGVAFALDLSSRKHLESQLLQSQKLEAIGKLAGGIAHDFNNLLTVIIGRTQMMLKRANDTHPFWPNLKLVSSTAERAAGLTRQLLQFSRQQVIQPKVINLNTIVQSMSEMLRRLIGENIELTTSLDDELPNVKCDKSQMEQVVLNLVVNARDAMPKGGTIMIETKRYWLDKAQQDSQIESKCDLHAMLAVTDNGEGMDKSTLAKIFEPFFTTKAVGKGTGMGLATVHGIVKQSGGDIRVYSEPNKFTTVQVFIPASDECVVDASSTTHQIALKNPTILLVEDDEAVSNLISEMLAEAGYVVLIANEGSSAINLSKQYDKVVDLLITDLVMPRMDGKQVALEISRQREGIKVLYISGYTSNASALQGVLESGANFLEKPFSAGSLLRKVNDILGQQ